MRVIFTSIVALLTLAGCDAGVFSGLGPAAADAERARDLFVRAQQFDSQAIGELESRAAKSDVVAAFYAGLANDPAVVPGGNPARAAEFYEVAARSSSGAKHNLALLILKGVLKSGQDASTAVKLLTEAAARDRLESMLMLASLFESGWEGIDRSAPLAAQWYERAMLFSNDPRAVLRVGAALQDGHGRPQDADQAEIYLLAAAKAGVAEAQYRMSRTVQDPMQVAQWMTVAALTDPKYQAAASAALQNLSGQDRARVKVNAELWFHAHARDTGLVSFTAPVMQP